DHGLVQRRGDRRGGGRRVDHLGEGRRVARTVVEAVAAVGGGDGVLARVQERQGEAGGAAGDVDRGLAGAVDDEGDRAGAGRGGGGGDRGGERHRLPVGHWGLAGGDAHRRAGLGNRLGEGGRRVAGGEGGAAVVGRGNRVRAGAEAAGRQESHAAAHIDWVLG